MARVIRVKALALVVRDGDGALLVSEGHDHTGRGWEVVPGLAD